MIEIFERVPPKRVGRYYSREQAGAYLRNLAPNWEMMALSNGQFSLSDLCEEILEQIGPADLDLSTWTASTHDASRKIELFRSGVIRKLRMLIDDIFTKAHPDIVREVLELGGEVRIVKTHAKFALFRNDKVQLTLVTSMNLNANPRVEFFQVSACPDMASFFQRLVDQACECASGQRVKLCDLPGFDDDDDGQALDW